MKKQIDVVKPVVGKFSKDATTIDDANISLLEIINAMNHELDTKVNQPVPVLEGMNPHSIAKEAVRNYVFDMGITLLPKMPTTLKDLDKRLEVAQNDALNQYVTRQEYSSADFTPCTDCVNRYFGDAREAINSAFNAQKAAAKKIRTT